MKRLLLLSLLPIAFLLLTAGVLTLRSSGEAQATAISGDSAACSAATSDAMVSSVDSAGPSLNSDEASLVSSCYFVGISIFDGGCGNQDEWVLRYLCPYGTGWRYVNYWFCV